MLGGETDRMCGLTHASIRSLAALAIIGISFDYDTVTTVYQNKLVNAFYSAFGLNVNVKFMILKEPPTC